MSSRCSQDTYLARDNSKIDNVSAKGPRDWKLVDGIPAKYPANPNICLVLWEFFELINRILQRRKYCSGTFLGHKLVLYSPTFKIPTHICTPSDCVPNKSYLALLECWGPCKLLIQVRVFLGTVGILCIFVKNFAHCAHHLIKLTCTGVPFEFGPDQINAQKDLVKALQDAKPLIPIIIHPLTPSS